MLGIAMATVLAMITGCKGKPLPEGMDEDALFVAGKDVVLLLVGSEFETVHEMLREDVKKKFGEDYNVVVTIDRDYMTKRY